MCIHDWRGEEGCWCQVAHAHPNPVKASIMDRGAVAKGLETRPFEKLKSITERVQGNIQSIM